MTHFREAWVNLYFFILCSLLAVLGVLVGTASVVAMVMGGQLATNEALKQFKSLGTDLLAVYIDQSRDGQKEVTMGKVDHLTLDHALAIPKLDPAIVAVAPYTQLFQPAFFKDKKIMAMTLGVTGSFASMVNIPLQDGRFISLFDGDGYYCVIGHQV